ncbi:putative zinc finger/helix-turn-helix protein, YgiT family [Haploplasma axanthum]|uniref:Putative zinc finger/helix-turn-helix protein, YgiT family n=1 Tax=Haploplasma axanthum TaxID=29552 RepID=A0A449BBJ7_HAPAX|nr:putative zinc finger/helix-turn-helix protein, YgiT family [Haploplasma axanthum]
MSQLLGFGEKTVTRYENGYIQDKSNDILMRLVDDKESFEQILKLSNNGKLVAKIKNLYFKIKMLYLHIVQLIKLPSRLLSR